MRTWSASHWERFERLLSVFELPEKLLSVEAGSLISKLPDHADVLAVEQGQGGVFNVLPVPEAAFAVSAEFGGDFENSDELLTRPGLELAEGVAGEDTAPTVLENVEPAVGGAEVSLGVPVVDSEVLDPLVSPTVQKAHAVEVATVEEVVAIDISAPVRSAFSVIPWDGLPVGRGEISGDLAVQPLFIAEPTFGAVVAMDSLNHAAIPQSSLVSEKDGLVSVSEDSPHNLAISYPEGVDYSAPTGLYFGSLSWDGVKRSGVPSSLDLQRSIPVAEVRRDAVASEVAAASHYSGGLGLMMAAGLHSAIQTSEKVGSRAVKDVENPLVKPLISLSSDLGRVAREESPRELKRAAKGTSQSDRAMEFFQSLPWSTAEAA